MLENDRDEYTGEKTEATSHVRTSKTSNNISSESGTLMDLMRASSVKTHSQQEMSFRMSSVHPSKSGLTAWQYFHTYFRLILLNSEEAERRVCKLKPDRTPSDALLAVRPRGASDSAPAASPGRSPMPRRRCRPSRSRASSCGRPPPCRP